MDYELLTCNCSPQIKEKGGVRMAVLLVPYDSVLQLRLVTGINPETSKPIIRSKSFSRVKYGTDEQDIFDVANQLVSLQKYNLNEIRLNQSAQLTS
jgi:hypothetical protein